MRLLITIILLFISINICYADFDPLEEQIADKILDFELEEFDYRNANRLELLQRCLEYAQNNRDLRVRLINIIEENNHLLDRVSIYQGMYNNLYNRYNALVNRYELLELELEEYKEYPFRSFDISLTPRLGFGTSIDIGLTGNMYIYNGLNVFISADFYYGTYMQSFEKYPYCLALIGVSYQFYWRF